ncbi:MAG TPA: FHA domain-containing protein [Candidatus Methylacidiphilales bacterium]
MPRLVAQSPEFAGQTFDLSTPEITVGRLPDNQISIEHASISGHHATFKLNGLDYILQDLESTNGTRVNGEKISQQGLRRNDIVRFGNIEMLYDSEHSPPGQPMPTPSERVNLAECAAHGRPANFTNASPTPKKPRGAQSRTWTIVLSLLALFAVGAVGYFIWAAIVSAPTVS